MTCSFCEREFEYEPVTLDLAHETANLCSWLCVIAFAAAKEKARSDAMEARARKLEDDTYWLDFYRAGVI